MKLAFQSGLIYKFQKNFNPFVDHPEFADRIYNSDKLFVEKAEQVGSNLLLSFSKELNSNEAAKTANYNLDVLGNPSSVTPNFGGDSKKVLLSFFENFADTFYNVRVSNLTSSTGETILVNSIALFIAAETTNVDTIAPKTPTNLIATKVDNRRVSHILCKWQNVYLINGFSRLSNIMENCEKMKDQSLIGIVHFFDISL